MTQFDTGKKNVVVVVDLLFNVLPIVCRGSVFVCLFVCYALLYVHSSFVIILKRKRKLAALPLLSYRCLVIPCRRRRDIVLASSVRLSFRPSALFVWPQQYLSTY